MLKTTKIAQDELGYLEKSKSAVQKNPAVLDQKTAGAGKDNLTKYARDTGHPNGYAWCQTFIAYLFTKAFGKTVANQLLCGMISSPSTMEVKDKMISKGRGVPLSSAQEGDIVYRSRNGGGHVGYVVDRTSDGAIITIEGNSSSDDITAWNGGAVVMHKNAPWTWCVRPDYSIIPKYTPQTWYSDSKGWWYAKDEDTYARDEWLDINHHRYFFDKDGYAVTGHQIIHDKRYYFETSGKLQCAMMVTNGAGELIYKYV